MSRNRFILIAFCLFALTGCAREKPSPSRAQALPSATTLPAPVLAVSEKPLILIYCDSYGGRELSQAPHDQIDTAVWSDGRIVWQAGGSMRQARIDTKKIDELIQKLHRDGVFGDGNAYYGNVGPDSTFDVIDVRLPDRRHKLHSWHEGFEHNPKLVVTSRGVEALEGRNRDAVLAAEPPEYRRFLRIWSEIRTTVRSWVPSAGEPFTGTVPIDRGG
jgi:hypothetical protein